MINYIKNIKNPALKCFVQLFPIFIAFFIWIDFGTDIAQAVSSAFVAVASFFSPIFRFAGEYVMALIVFIALWSVCVFSKVVQSEKDLSIVRFWKNIGHAATIPLFFYCILYIIDTVEMINGMPVGEQKEIANLTGMLMISGAIAIVSVFANIFLFGRMSKFKDEQNMHLNIYD